MRGQRLAAALATAAGHLRRRSHLLAQWPEGPVPLGPQVALLCHYDAAGDVTPALLGYATALREAGFAVVLVSNSGRLRPAALTALRPLCAAVLVRRNAGWDFAAWQEAMRHLQLPRPGTERLLLTNDSVLGPFTPLPPLLARMDAGADLWALTDSDELGWHLQSYFLLANRTALDSQAWRRFWRRVRPLPLRYAVIRRYELGLSRQLAAAGLRLLALFPCQSVGCSPHDNPTLAAWDRLLAAGFPFVKRSLLRDRTVSPDQLPLGPAASEAGMDAPATPIPGSGTSC